MSLNPINSDLPRQENNYRAKSFTIKAAGVKEKSFFFVSLTKKDVLG
jgi:hypothetical protein